MVWLTLQGMRAIMVAMVAWPTVLRACTSNTEIREEAIPLGQVLVKLQPLEACGLCEDVVLESSCRSGHKTLQKSFPLTDIDRRLTETQTSGVRYAHLGE